MPYKVTLLPTFAPELPLVMQCEIVTIGDELLIGQTVDTNSAWIAKQLNAIGVSVTRITSIADEREAILTTLDEVGDRAQLVLMTGGLGPTRDDITKNTLCEYFETHLVMRHDIRQRIEAWFERRGIPVLEVNRRQAELPADCIVLENLLGTAQGMWFERDETVFVSMPGVPYEMQYIVEHHVLRMITERFKRPHIEHLTLMTSGIGESLLADKVKSWEDSLDAEGIHIAYLPSPGVVKVRLTLTGGDAEAIRTAVRKKADEFLAIAGEYVFAEGDTPIEKVVGDELRRRQLTIATAESCTGGRIASVLTAYPGSSAYFKGGVVAYDNNVKVGLLEVPEALIDHQGAVSEAVVKAMAEGVRRRLGTDIGVATSGVAGPDGGTTDKPVGLMWVAVATSNGVIAEMHNFGSDRERNMLRGVRAALNLVRHEILGHGVVSS